MAAQKMGFEGILYYGAAGSTASTQLTNTRDIKLELGRETGETTVRGDSTAPPIKTEETTVRVVGLEFEMLNDSGDASFTAMQTAAASGAQVALRGKSYSSGKGPDADFSLEMSAPWNLKGEQVVTFKGTPSRANRAPVNWT